MAAGHDAEILIETTRIGGAMEVRAVDASDGFEVSFIVPASAAQAEIAQLALAKLQYARSRRSRGEPGGDGRGGVVV